MKVETFMIIVWPLYFDFSNKKRSWTTLHLESNAEKPSTVWLYGDGGLKGEGEEAICKVPALSKSVPFSNWVWRNEFLIPEIETDCHLSNLITCRNVN